MNDPNKVISVNLSSLLSLKAELLRKQAEVSRTQATRLNPEAVNGKSSTGKSIPYIKKDKKNSVKEVEKLEDATVYELEDTSMLEKSKRVLEAKSKFYDRMVQSGGKLNTDDNCLVQFNRKHQDEKPYKSSYTTNENGNLSSSDTESEEYSKNSDDELVEYTDCLGRTRSCLQKDLEDAKKRDSALAASMPERIDQTKANWLPAANDKSDDSDCDLPFGPLPSESVYGDGSSIISKHDEQRANWERKELENFDKPDVHYQDVFFDEARQHGVGYYAFSTDEEERQRQQRDLEGARETTLSEQEHRKKLREEREKIIAERVLAAKNRQRARLGLPPIDPQEEVLKKSEEAPVETRKERRERKRNEIKEHLKEAEEKERQIERDQHVRPWDKSKKPINNEEGDEEWAYQPERLPMSQEEWNEHKRAERIDEFAPPKLPVPHVKRKNFNSSSIINYNMVPPPPPLFVNHQTSKKWNPFKQRNSDLHATTDPSKRDELNRHVGAAIPPPANLEDQYMVPSKSKKPKSNEDLERSIEAGLRFLRDSGVKNPQTSTKSSWTAKADY